MGSKLIFARLTDALLLPLYVTTVGYWEHQEETSREAGFPDFQIHQVLSGKGELMYNNYETVVGPGDVFFLFPDVPHRYVPVSNQWEVAWVSFNGREASQLLAFARITGSGVSQLKDVNLLASIEAMLALDDEDSSTEFERSKLMYNLLLDLKRQLIMPAGEARDEDKIRPALLYIQNHLHKALSLQEIAEAAALSPQYICRLFQKTLSIRPMEYINQERINVSKKLMFSKRSKKLYEIAQEAGFDNASYFSVVFKRYTGMSPEQFKKLHGL
ncbi:AraC family ligand binding domain-containing protein [Paenibacillus sp. GXUN7292]|uniref:AraC family transcriptional regulator n=1 Tax=Paenibacillus sp. GXUN7292 TaxID=3422499 RepID=UPI003D7E6602